MGIYAAAPILRSVLAPIAGSFIAEYTTWRCVFWSSSALAGAISLLGLVWLGEIHAETILKRKRGRLVKMTGNNKLYVATSSPKSILRNISTSLERPPRLLATQPIAQIISLYIAYIFGMTYPVIATLPPVWTEVYGQSLDINGLNYLSIGIGSLLSIVANFFSINRVYRYIKQRNGDVGRPELRMPSMFAGSFLVTVGLLWYGWSVQAHVHWIMPNIGMVLFAAGNIACSQSMQTYTIDSYTRFGASCMAAIAVLRSLGGFTFPLFTPYLYQDLRYR